MLITYTNKQARDDRLPMVGQLPRQKTEHGIVSGLPAVVLVRELNVECGPAAVSATVTIHAGRTDGAVGGFVS